MSSPPVVVLVNHRSLDHIRRLFASGALSALDVIVVDNGSDPVEVTEICSEHAARPLLLERNIGFAGGVNAALERIQDPGAEVLILNPDVHLTPDVVARLRRQLLETGATAVAPVLVDARGSVQVGCAGASPTVAHVAAYFLFVSALLPWVKGVFWTRRQAVRGGTADWLCMACLLAKRSAFTTFGPLPVHELAYAEDVAWGSRATRSGAAFLLDGATRVRHDQGTSSGASSSWARAMERLFARELPPHRADVAIWAMRIGLLLRRGVRRLRALPPQSG